MSEAPQFLNVQRHMVHMLSIPRPLRLLVGLGVAQGIAGVLTLLFKDADFPAIVVARQGGADLRMGLPFLFLAMALLIVGWTYVLTGALHARSWASFAILAVATVVVWGTTTGSEGWPLAPLALAGFWMYFLARKTLLRGVRLRIDLLLVGLLVGVLDLAPLIVALGIGGDLWQFPLNVSFQIVALIGLLVPMLVLAGIDITEVALESSAWVTGRLATLIPLRIYAAALIALAAAKVGLGIVDGSSLSGGVFVALGIVFGLALLSYLWRHRSAHHHEPPFWLLLVLSSALFVVPLIVLVAGQWLPLTVVQSVSGTDLRFAWGLAGIMAAAIALLAILAARLRRKPIDPPLLFVLIYGLWIVLTVGNPMSLPQAQASGSELQFSVTLGELDIATSIGVALAAAALLARRQLAPRPLGFLAAALFALSILSGVNSLYEQQFSFSDLLVLLQAAVFLVVPAMATAKATRSRRAREKAGRGRSLLWFALALVGLVVALVLGGGALPRLPVGLAFPPDGAAVLILALALLWDFLMSGERFTNHHGRHFPRTARLLLYVGYASLTSAVLLWTKTLTGGSQQFFDENLLPRFGLVVLGMPVIFYLWALSGSQLWSRRALDGPESSGTG